MLSFIDSLTALRRGRHSSLEARTSSRRLRHATPQVETLENIVSLSIAVTHTNLRPLSQRVVQVQVPATTTSKLLSLPKPMPTTAVRSSIGGALCTPVNHH